MTIKRWLVALLLLLVVVGGTLAGLYLTGRLWAEDPHAELPWGIYPLGEFITNLSSESGQRFIRVRLDVDIAGRRPERELTAKRSQLRDGVLAVLRSSHHDELSEERGMSLLAQQLLRSINEILEEATVRRVLFVEFVIQ